MFLKRSEKEGAFFAIEKSIYSRRRIQKILPLFLLLWFGAACIGLFFQNLIYNHLSTFEQQQSRHLLECNIQARGDGGAAFFAAIKKSPGQTLRSMGLLFIRIVREKEQILITGKEAKELDFVSLAALEAAKRHQRQRVWLTIPPLPQRITLYTLTYKNFSIQAGKDSTISWQLYQETRRKIWLFIAALPAVLLPLCLLIAQKAAAPLIAARKKSGELAASHNSELLFESGDGSEFDALCHEINNLVLRNRRLTEEMQNSLDNVAHDLRTPMTRLRSTAEYGLREENPEKLRNALADCLEEAEEVLAMLSVMMSVAEAEAGTMRLAKCPVDLRESLQRAVTLYEYVAEEKNITVTLQAEPLPAMADAALCTRVWANLLDNAIKYGKEGGWVNIEGYHRIAGRDDEIIIRFSDNGMGISERECSRIWERLYRGDRSRSQRGLGLGLNYVKAVIEAHGGTVSVKSELEKGTEFEVRLRSCQEQKPEGVKTG